MNLEYPNLVLKQYPKKFQNIFSKDTCKVAVNYCIYDKRKKIMGTAIKGVLPREVKKADIPEVIKKARRLV